MPTHGTDYSYVKTTLPDVLAGANGGIYVVLSWHDVENPPKLIDPKLKIGKTLNKPLMCIGQSEHDDAEIKIKFACWISI